MGNFVKTIVRKYPREDFSINEIIAKFQEKEKITLNYQSLYVCVKKLSERGIIQTKNLNGKLYFQKKITPKRPQKTPKKIDENKTPIKYSNFFYYCPFGHKNTIKKHTTGTNNYFTCYTCKCAFKNYLWRKEKEW